MADQSANLLLLREADVVRLCGLATAAQALEMVRAGEVSGGTRVGARLTAHVRHVAEQENVAWLEARAEPAPASFTWGCTCPRGLAAAQPVRATGGTALACAHVAALLTTWVRHPESFLDEGDPVGPSHMAATSTSRVANAPPRQPPAAPRAEESRAGTVSLRGHLRRLPARALRTARQRVLGDAADASAPSDDPLDGLYEALTDPVLLAALCATLDDDALLLLRGLVLHGGALTESAMSALGARAGLTRAAQIVARHTLRACCLLFAIGDDDAAPAGWNIPPEVLRHLEVGLGLRPLELARAPKGSGTGQPGSGADGGDERTIELAPLRALCLTVTLMARTRDQLRPSRVAGASPQARFPTVGELPRAADDVSAAALGSWAHAAGIAPELARFAYRLMWAAMQGSESGAGHQHPLLALECLPVAEWVCALRMGLAAWLDSRTHAELADLAGAASGVRVRCDPRHSAFSLTALAAENAEARARIVHLFRQMRPGSWYAVADLVALVWKLDPFFLRGRQRAFETPSWWIEALDSARPLRPDVEPEWMCAEGQYIRALVAGPLHWLGVVDIARDGQGGVSAFRCTAWAPYLLGVSADVPAEATRLAEGWGEAVRPAGAAGVSTQPLALAPTGSMPLDAWASVTGVREGRLVWRFSPDHACANLDAGRQPTALLAWLRTLDTRDRTRAAPHVAALFERWQRLYGATRLEREVVIVEAQDALALHEALAAANALSDEPLLLAPGVAAFPRRAAEQLERALTGRGYLI